MSNELVAVKKQSLYTWWPKFLLIQDDKILDVCWDPAALNWQDCDNQRDITVALGYLNEFGVREIAGICGQYHYKPFAQKWQVTTSTGSAKGIIHSSYQVMMCSPKMLLKSCLVSIHQKGQFEDPANLATVTIQSQPIWRK